MMMINGESRLKLTERLLSLSKSRLSLKYEEAQASIDDLEYHKIISTHILLYSLDISMIMCFFKIKEGMHLDRCRGC